MAALSTKALKQIRQKLTARLPKGAAFAEEHGPSFAEWRGEHKKGALGEVSLPALKTDVLSAFSKILDANKGLSKSALIQLDRKRALGTSAAGAFVEEHGPSWVEWSGEHKKGDLGIAVLPALKANVKQVFRNIK